MTFNADKFECLRFWPGKEPEPDSTPIEAAAQGLRCGDQLRPNVPDLPNQQQPTNQLAGLKEHSGGTLVCSC